MDVSIIAAIGSFAISERVLRPKATILVILASILAYDLTTKTHDPSSLRIYRGPALAAFTLMCTAYSLRTWRRNGVACDELLFLPGTPYDNRNNSNKDDDDTNNNMITDDHHNLNAPESPESAEAHIHIISEGDAAGGIALQPIGSRDQSEPLMDAIVPVVTVSSSPTRSEGGSSSLGARRMSSIGENDDDNKSKNGDLDLDSWDESSKSSCSSVDEEAGTGGGAVTQDHRRREPRRNNPFCPSYYGQSRAERRSVNGSFSDGESRLDEGGTNGTPESGQRRTGFQRFRESHPRITRLGTFFFFRTNSSPSESTMYAPSGPMVFGAALDLSMPILFNFHLFIEAYNHISSSGGSDTPAKILPLIFFSVLMVRSVVPPGRRGRFWSTVKFTAMAPFHTVNFRDAFVGDVMTSLVRPIQDFLFALTYYFTVVWGTLFSNYSLTQVGHILERSWFLHNIVLTSFAILPLWWKFLQCLRMSYDSGQRWPYLGDAFKYLSAALVILFGMTHPEDRICFWWVVSFIATTLYQIWWDTVMDWELFVITPRNESPSSSESPCCSCAISSLRPTSSILLTIQMYLIQPLEDAVRRVCHAIPNLDQIKLRQKRLYKTEKFYWKIFVFNAVFRFTWMLCFIPPFKLSGEKEQIFSSDVSTPIGVLLPILEILRRTFWGFLKVETETLRLMDADAAYTRVENNSDVEENGSEKFRPSAFHQFMPVWMDTEQRQKQMAATSSSTSKLQQYFQCSDSTLDKLFLAELSLWALTFVGFGYVTAYA
eukprot:CAMPEP_0195290904 /NCGR_PEP_ID=MMETSP0707-20130614/6581_1 /TAXON_ID=33640 /ORGANISM="Asterionellopsis glacialis, Strain CCMP134" /LENGTH=769 /DNA_ID=CAMNT_0040351087 /DNA_START=135 /DNA_END=2444 /DNA_ORIENTATION=-